MKEPILKESMENFQGDRLTVKDIIPKIMEDETFKKIFEDQKVKERNIENIVDMGIKEALKDFEALKKGNGPVVSSMKSDRFASDIEIYAYQAALKVLGVENSEGQILKIKE
jgi:hypothetical protein